MQIVIYTVLGLAVGCVLGVLLPLVLFPAVASERAGSFLALATVLGGALGLCAGFFVRGRPLN